jgi:hypothetical protein
LASSTTTDDLAPSRPSLALTTARRVYRGAVRSHSRRPGRPARPDDVVQLVAASPRTPSHGPTAAMTGSALLIRP